MDAADSLKKAQGARKPHLYVGTCSHSEVSPFYYAVTELSAESNIHAHSVSQNTLTCKQIIALYLSSKCFQPISCNLNYRTPYYVALYFTLTCPKCIIHFQYL